MKFRLLYSGLLLLFVFFTLGSCAQAGDDTTFKRLSSLKGKWQGTYEWTGERAGGGDVTATYYLTGNGSALVEDLAYGSEPIMTSVYHMDGDTLRMTPFAQREINPGSRRCPLTKMRKCFGLRWSI